MKVMVSKVMVNELKKYFKDKPPFNEYEFVFDEFSKRTYEFNVDMYSYRHEVDWQMNKGLFKVIKIIYPYDYYSMPHYLTTRDLSRCFKESDRTYEGFMKAVANEIEI